MFFLLVFVVLEFLICIMLTSVGDIAALWFWIWGCVNVLFVNVV